MDERTLSRRGLLKTAQLLPLAGLLPGAAAAAESNAPSTGGSKVTVTPFHINVPQARLDHIKARIANAEWPDVPEGAPWQYGTEYSVMKELVSYWQTKYDWRAREAVMNKWPNFKARIDDYDIHFIHEKGSGKNPQPMIITHGWPGSFTEFMKVIDPLAHPEKYGGDAEDGLTVVVPSIPGFAFSSKPKKPIGVRRVAGLWDRLMTDGLGYTSYITQGGDYGSQISNWLGAEGKGCKAVHLNFLLGVTAQAQNDDEKAAMAQWGKVYQAEGAYIHVQSTKPLTFGYAMTDSPLGAAAWIFEKMKTWSDLKNGDPWSVYSHEDVLDNIMVYLVTNTFGTASWMYASFTDGPALPPAPITRPTAVAHFPGELVFWPRSYAERTYKLVRWTDMPVGGHFAALEQPKLFADDVRAFAKMVKTA